ncbi:MAG: flagellar basal body rod protein FlgC [Planctomycetota bacterium]
MYGALDISTSGMIVQRTRMAAISANIANAGTTLDAQANPSAFKRRVVHIAPGDPNAQSAAGRGFGVHVREIEAVQNAVRLDYQPSNPYADADGYVKVPDINIATEQINALLAGRAYEANVAAAETTKTMMQGALQLLA